MTGQFHLSLGCEFEDRNDCKPFFDRKFVLDYLNKFFISFNLDEQSRFRILSQVNSMSCPTNEQAIDFFVLTDSQYR